MLKTGIALIEVALIVIDLHYFACSLGIHVIKQHVQLKPSQYSIECGICGRKHGNKQTERQTLQLPAACITLPMSAEGVTHGWYDYVKYHKAMAGINVIHGIARYGWLMVAWTVIVY